MAAAGAVTIAVVAVLAILGGSGEVPVSPTGSPTASIAAAGSSPTGGIASSPSAGFPSASPSPAPSASPGASVAKRIRIPRLKIDLKVVEGDGIDAPLDSAAHFPGTAWPGGGSNIYIYAHARKGLFINLWDARKGDEVYLDTVDGRTVTYVVDEIRPKTPWNAVELLEPTDEERLTLQTSTSYTATAPRFVVIALPRP
jgi:LPXTG-site transpeptidase (sortase) family protein